MATHSNILVWRISWTEESRGLQSTGLHRIRNDWSNLACTPILNTLSSWTNPSYTVSFLPLFLSAAFSSFLSFLLLSFLKKKKKDFLLSCYGFISENLLRNLPICYLYQLNATSDAEIHRHCKIWWGNSLVVWWLNLHFHCGGPDLILGLGTKNPQASRCGRKKKKSDEQGRRSETNISWKYFNL